MVVALSARPAAAAKTDIVVLTNGDRMTGEITQLERGYLVYKTDNMGTLNIEWDKVAQVTANTSFEVDDLQGGIYFGTLQPGPAEGQLTISGLVGHQTVALADVVRIRRLGDSFWDGVNGVLNAGLSYTSSTELFALDLYADITFERPSYEVSATFSSTLTRQPEIDDTRRNSLTLGYVHRYSNRWVAFAVAEMEQNQALGINLRSSLAGGGGRFVVQNPNNELLLGVGLNVNREVPVEGASTDNAELMLPLRYSKFAYDFPKVDINVDFATFVGLTDWGRVRAALSVRLTRELIKDFNAALIGWESYDSRPPTPDGPNHDYGLTFTLGWTF